MYYVPAASKSWPLLDSQMKKQLALEEPIDEDQPHLRQVVTGQSHRLLSQFLAPGVVEEIQGYLLRLNPCIWNELHEIVRFI